MDPAFTQVLASMGLPGVVIASLAWVAWQKSKQVDALHETRVQEAREIIDAINHNTTSLERLSTLIQDRSGNRS